MRPKRRNIDQLAARLSAVMEWIDGQSGKIKDALGTRNVVLAEMNGRASIADMAASLAREDAEKYRARATEALQEAEKLQLEAERCLAHEEKYLGIVARSEARAAAVRDEAKSVRKEWAAHMRLYLQGGKYRRYSRDKVKLQRRLDTKRKDAERFAKLKEPLTAAEIAMGVTVNEKLRQLEGAE
jgi:hypothetical protein